jgi:hypothetical protein
MPFDGVDFQVAAEPVQAPWQQVLLDAADYIETHGLAKMVLCDAAGRRCAIGAIYDSNYLDADISETPAMREAHGRLTSYVYNRHLMIVSSWNNMRERTADEVCAAMRDCARG